MQPAKTTVLLAEGAGTMRQALASQLEGVGFGQVLQARDGLKALQILRAEPVHVVVADMDMQVHNGLEVLEAMRIEPRLAALPFILMSSGLDRQSAAKAIHLGINDLLIKPFTVKRLLERIACLRATHPSPLRRTMAAPNAPRCWWWTTRRTTCS
jgi:CheY-like chemotaxis protein